MPDPGPSPSPSPSPNPSPNPSPSPNPKPEAEAEAEAGPEPYPGALGEQAQAKLKGALAEPKASREEKPMPEGFCRTTRGNLQASSPGPTAQLP